MTGVVEGVTKNFFHGWCLDKRIRDGVGNEKQ